MLTPPHTAHIPLTHHSRRWFTTDTETEEGRWGICMITMVLQGLGAIGGHVMGIIIIPGMMTLGG